MSFTMPFAPVVPERKRKPTDREWMAAYVQRHSGLSQNQQLGRTWAEGGLRAERRTAARSRVDAMLRSAAEASPTRSAEG